MLFLLLFLVFQSERYAIVVDVATNAVTGTWRGPYSISPPKPDINKELLIEIQEGQYNYISDGITYGRFPRFYWRDNRIEEIPDPRVVIIPTPDSARVNRNGSVKVEFQTAVDTSGIWLFELPEQSMRIAFKDGKATLRIHGIKETIYIKQGTEYVLRPPLRIYLK